MRARVGQTRVMDALWKMTAGQLATAIAQREVSSSEVLEAHLRRIEDVNPYLNAIVGIMQTEARDAAERADAAVEAGESLGPLHGVPVSIKENVDVAGTPTTQGLTALAEAIADRDAPVVERLRSAGAIVFARTNMPDVGLRIHTDSQLHGLTRNPWNPAVTAGGSSGGEASALAAGMTPLGIGNDIGGSLRNPAHCCGIASIKPTTGLVPQATVIEPIAPNLAAQLMSVTGPMARSVSDVRTALGVIAGADRRDPVSVPATLNRRPAGERLRIAVLPEPPGGSTAPGIAAGVRRAADVLANAGHDVVEVAGESAPPRYEELIMLWSGLLASDLAVQAPLLRAVMGEAGTVVIDQFLATAAEIGPADVFSIHTERYLAMAQWSQYFEQYPILLTPTWSLRAFEHDADLADGGAGIVLETFRSVLHANFLGLPAAVVPAAIDDGLPVGVQVIGDRFDDLVCLDIAEEIEDALGAVTPIDPVTAT